MIRTSSVCLEHGGIIRSFDRGKSWEDVSGGIDYHGHSHITSAPGRKICICRQRAGFFKSERSGPGWQRAETVLRRDYFHDFVFLPLPLRHAVAAADKSPAIGTVRASTGRIFRSRDLAESWERVGTGNWLPENMKQMVWALTQHPEDPSMSMRYLAPCRAGVRRMPHKRPWRLLVSKDRRQLGQLPLDLPADRCCLSLPILSLPESAITNRTMERVMSFRRKDVFQYCVCHFS